MVSPRRPSEEWERADAHFVGIGDDEAGGRWRHQKPVPETWRMEYDGVAFLGRFTNFRHVGVFPEQVSHWQWIMAEIARAARPLRILNLFAYTGIVSLLAAREVRRGSRYDGIILDPPKFGRGPKGEVWDIFANLKPLLLACRTLLSDKPAFLI